MCSKTITSVFGIIIVLSFGYMSYKDAVRIWQNLQDQSQQIELLAGQNDSINKEIEETIKDKEQKANELHSLEIIKQRLESEKNDKQSQLVESK